MENNSSGTIGSMLSKPQRLFLGCVVLLLVDVMWVFTSELTQFIYKEETYEKPFFCTYIGTSLFTFYLLGLVIWPPWRDGCIVRSPESYHHLVDTDSEDGPESSGFSDVANSLSNPVYVPVKVTADSRAGSGTEESDDSSVRSVRFNKVAEVRHMSEVEAREALLARLSYQASLRAGEVAKRAAVKLPVLRVARIALIFCVLWFMGNYTYQLALTATEASTVNVLLSSSSLFTLILAAIFPSSQGDKFSLSKLAAVFLSIIGIMLVSLSDLQLESHLPFGAVMSLVSALLYSIYLVFLKKKIDHEYKIDIPLFFGFVGLFNVLLLWPVFFFLHFSEIETFEMPSGHQLLYLLLNGLLGTVIPETLWLWGCFLTSSLIATVAISLTIPMTMFADVVLKRVSYPWLFYGGTLPTAAAFLALTALSHYDNWDPVYDLIHHTYLFLCRKTRFIRIRLAEMPSEQTEALIGINSSYEHES